VRIILCKPGHIVPSNTHFDTTRANIESNGARALDLPTPAAADTQARVAFKGNLDIEALEKLIQSEASRIFRW
jgi:tyrosine phenol-lyase